MTVKELIKVLSQYESDKLVKAYNMDSHEVTFVIGIDLSKDNEILWLETDYSGRLPSSH